MGDIYHSILSSHIVVEEDAVIRDSILYQGVRIGSKSIIKNAIIMDQTIIPPNTSLLFEDVTVVDQDWMNEMRDRDE